MSSFERVAWGTVVLRLRGLFRPPVNPTLFLLLSRLMVRNHRKFSRTPELYATWDTQQLHHTTELLALQAPSRLGHVCFTCARLGIPDHCCQDWTPVSF
jgi:hypothetical protein